jgi:hypothetical protein
MDYPSQYTNLYRKQSEILRIYLAMFFFVSLFIILITLTTTSSPAKIFHNYNFTEISYYYPKLTPELKKYATNISHEIYFGYLKLIIYGLLQITVLALIGVKIGELLDCLTSEHYGHNCTKS